MFLTASLSPSNAFEIFGFKFFEKEPEETVELIDPVKYSARLNTNGANETVTKALSAASSLIRDQDQPVSGRAGLLSKANAEYARLIDTLYTLGHYAGTVSITLGGREVSDIPLDVELANPSQIVINVKTGPLYRFGQATIENLRPETDLTDSGFETGSPAYSVAVRDAGRRAVLEWQKQGYAKADIPQTSVTADHAKEVLDARLTVVPGPKITYGPITVEGSDYVRPEFIQYMADMPKGETYNPEVIDKARKRLLNLDTFGVVEIEQGDPLVNGSMPLKIQLQDRKLRRLGVGATVSTIDGIGVEGFWLHRNILSRAERLRFDGSVKGIGRSLDPEDYDYALGVSLIKPGTITPDTDFRLRLGVSREKLDNYDALTWSLSTGFASQINERLTSEIDFVIERSRIDDSLGRRYFSLLGFDGALTYERRDDPLDATSGYYLEFHAFPFYESKTGQIGVQTTAEGRAYQRVGETDAFVLAGRAKVGTVSGLSITEAPPQVLFFSGGGGSVRGFEYLSDGVTLPSGQEVGGRSLLEASAELRAKLSDNFGMVGFIDGGIVGTNSTPDITQEIKVGVGVGLRWRTGLGPLRVDIARAVNRKSSDPQLGVYIGLGQAF